MKKGLKKFLFICVTSMLFLPCMVKANIICNDGTVSPSCGDCHRGCCSKHGGCTSGASAPSINYNEPSNNQNSNPTPAPTQPVIVEQPKSSDTSLKLVTINNDNITISNNMFYSTYEEVSIIYALANDSKAKVEYDKDVKLNIGNNSTTIKVTAENGNVKEYQVNITREKILSDNKNIKVTIDNREIIFNDFISETINIPYTKNELNIEYELEDSNAKAEIIGNENLIVGENKIIIRVTAENLETQDYIIMVNKEEHKETPTNSNNEEPIAEEESDNSGLIPAIGTISIFGGLGYLIFSKMKK